MGWLDIIPAWPLARGVPVVSRDGRRRMIVTGVDHTGRHAVTQLGACALDEVRIDLDDPQGMAYALQRSGLHMRGVPPHERHIWERWLAGATTNADRTDVARCLAEVAHV